MHEEFLVKYVSAQFNIIWPERFLLPSSELQYNITFTTIPVCRAQPSCMLQCHIHLVLNIVQSRNAHHKAIPNEQKIQNSSVLLFIS